MTQGQLSQARNKDLPASLIAMRRAAQMAREQAVRTETAIVVLRNEMPVRVAAEELRKAGVRWRADRRRPYDEMIDPERRTPMSSMASTLEKQALKLSPEERARLADRLIASLGDDGGVEEAWAAEVERRIADIEAGRVQTVPAAEAIERARRALG